MRYLHVSAISQAISATARESVAHAVGLLAGGGGQLCYDTNLRLKLWTLDEARREIEATARHATILKTSQEDGAVLTGLTDVADIARYFRSLGSQTVIVTQGADGVYVASGDDSFHVAGRQVAAVDATGAGDGFTGALLAELCRGQPLRQAVTFANAAAALSTLGYGAVAPLPRREQVAAFLAA